MEKKTKIMQTTIDIYVVVITASLCIQKNENNFFKIHKSSYVSITVLSCFASKSKKLVYQQVLK